MSITSRIFTAAILAIVPIIAAAESVTLDFFVPTYAGTVAIDPKGAVDKVLVNADKYFESVEVQNVFYDWECVSFGAKNGNDYPFGLIKLNLTDWFKTKRIKNVSVTAAYLDVIDKDNSMIGYGVHLFANGVKSEAFINVNDENRKRTIVSEINQLCETLTLQMAVQLTQTQYDSRVEVRSLIIDYEDGAPTPVVIDPAAGLDSFAVGESVKLNDCVVMENNGQFIAHVLKQNNGVPVITNNQPETYAIPVEWSGVAKNDLLVNISGVVKESNGVKVIEIQSVEDASPQLEHSFPTIYVNDKELDSSLLHADDKIEFVHSLGDNVAIYYVKRAGVEIDPTNARIDPAVFMSTLKAPAKAEAVNDPGLDEYGTFIYTGPFRLVHADNLATTSQSDVALKLQVHSAPTLIAGASWLPSNEFAITNEITTGAVTIVASDADTEIRYIDLQGRPVDNPYSGQLLIRIADNGAKAVIID